MNFYLPTIPVPAVSLPANTAFGAVLTWSSQLQVLPLTHVLFLTTLQSLQQLVHQILRRLFAPADCPEASFVLVGVQRLSHSAACTADLSHLSIPIITSKYAHLQHPAEPIRSDRINLH